MAFYTGRQGLLWMQRHFYLPARKKEVIILRTGKNIIPKKLKRTTEIAPHQGNCVIRAEGPSGDLAMNGLHAVVVPDLKS